MLGFSGSGGAPGNQLLFYDFTEMPFVSYLLVANNRNPTQTGLIGSGNCWFMGMKNTLEILSISLHLSAQLSSGSVSHPGRLSLQGGRAGQQ